MNLTEIVKDWESAPDQPGLSALVNSNIPVWKIAPAGLPWIKASSWLKVGNGVDLNPDAKLGHRVVIGDNTVVDAATIYDCVTIAENVWINANVEVHSFTVIDEGVKTAYGVKIGEHCVIETSTYIFDNAILEDNVHLGWDSLICRDAKIPAYTTLGSSSTVGDGATNPIDLGFADGFRKIFCEVNGVAYICAGCRFFPLHDALLHWSNHASDRTVTMALMESAKALAKLRGLKFNKEE